MSQQKAHSRMGSQFFFFVKLRFNLQPVSSEFSRTPLCPPIVKATSSDSEDLATFPGLVQLEALGTQKSMHMVLLFVLLFVEKL